MSNCEPHSRTGLLSHSTGSSMPNSIQSLSTNNGAIFKNPCGKLIQGVPFKICDEEDAPTVDEIGNNNDWNDEREELLNQLTDLVNVNGPNVTTYSTIKQYKMHSWIFATVLLGLFAFSCYYFTNIILMREELMRNLIIAYTKVDIKKARFTFYTIVPSKVYSKTLKF